MRIDMTQSYVWNTDSPFLFSKALGYSCVKDKISSFLKSSSLDIADTVLANFNDIIETGCKLALRKRTKY